MNGSNYERYKVELARDEEKKLGEKYFILGLYLIALVLLFLPDTAKIVSEISGDSLKERHVYYIEELQILDAKVAEEEDAVYCIARFYDKDKKPWIICCNPKKDVSLVERIKSAERSGKESDIALKMEGYFYVEETEGKSGINYDVRKGNFKDYGNILDLNATYLCTSSGNYIWETFLLPGTHREAMVWGVIGLIHSLYIKRKYHNRKLKERYQ